jgi:hypothetical protein
VEKAQNSETDSKPANVVSMPKEEAKPAGEQQPSSSAASAESQPQNTTSPSVTETTGASTATKEEKAPAAPAKAPFVLPPSKMPADWLPKSEDVDKLTESEAREALTFWLKTEELNEEEFLAWCHARKLVQSNQNVGDLTGMKVKNVLKQRSIVRKNILEKRS